MIADYLQKIKTPDIPRGTTVRTDDALEKIRHSGLEEPNISYLYVVGNDG